MRCARKHLGSRKHFAAVGHLRQSQTSRRSQASGSARMHPRRSGKIGRGLAHARTLITHCGHAHPPPSH